MPIMSCSQKLHYLQALPVCPNPPTQKCLLSPFFLFSPEKAEVSLQVLESAYRDQRNQPGFSWQQQYFTLRRIQGISVFAACGQLFPLGAQGNTYTCPPGSYFQQNCYQSRLTSAHWFPFPGKRTKVLY